VILFEPTKAVARRFSAELADKITVSSRKEQLSRFPLSGVIIAEKRFNVST